MTILDAVNQGGYTAFYTPGSHQNNMNNATDDTNTSSDRIKLPISFDTRPLLEEIRGLQLKDFIYYDVFLFKTVR